MVRFVSAFDDVYAPILGALDSLAAYFDPALAPEDFLAWLATWVGVDLDDEWDVDTRRRVIADAARLHRQRGTAAGIRAVLEQALGAEVTVADSGSCSWSGKPGTDPQGSTPPSVTVTVTVDDPKSVDVRRVEALLEDVCPAHVARHYSVVRAAGGEKQ